VLEGELEQEPNAVFDQPDSDNKYDEDDNATTNEQ